MKANGFPKAEHLCLKRHIDALFTRPDGHATAWPLRLVWQHTDEGACQMLVSVAKRHLHHAVDRNRAKRQVREHYRLNKSLLHEDGGQPEGLHLAFIWMADKPVESLRVEQSVIRLLKVCRAALDKSALSQE